jgi:hypothetical protein
MGHTGLARFAKRAGAPQVHRAALHIAIALASMRKLDQGVPEFGSLPTLRRRLWLRKHDRVQPRTWPDHKE